MPIFLNLRAVLLAALPAALAVVPGPVQAAVSLVQVQLWDKGPDSMVETGHGVGMGDPAKAMMGLGVRPTTVKAGDVRFEVVNTSNDTIHEMVVIRAPKDGKDLPFDPTMNKFDEDAAGHLGEVSELEPGKSGALRVHLKPGKYLLSCNVPGHYMGGMWTTLTVK